LGLAAIVSLALLVIAINRTAAEAGACGHGAATFSKVWGKKQASALRSSFESRAPAFGGATADDIAGQLDRWGAEWSAAYDDACRSSEKPDAPDAATSGASLACLDWELAEVGLLVKTLEGVDVDGTAHAAGVVASMLPDIDRCAGTAALSLPSLPADPELRHRALASRDAVAAARAALGLGQLSNARESARVAVSEARGSKHPASLGEALLASAHIERASGASDASSVAEEALLVLQEARDDRGVARASILIATIAGARHDWTAARQAVAFAEAAVARAGRPRALEADLAEAMGVVYLAQGRLAESERELGRAMYLANKLDEDEGARGARILTNLGNLARATGDEDLALERHQRAMAIDEKRLSKDHPIIGRHLHNIAGVLKLQGKRDEARSTYDRALEITKRALGPDHPDVALTLNSLAIMMTEDGRFDAARAAYREAIRIFSHAGHAQAAEVKENLSKLEDLAAIPPLPPPAKPLPRPPPKELPARPAPTGGTYMPSPAWP
jgi:serine/threonine-protein kinase